MRKYVVVLIAGFAVMLSIMSASTWISFADRKEVALQADILATKTAESRSRVSFGSLYDPGLDPTLDIIDDKGPPSHTPTPVPEAHSPLP